MTEGFVTKDSGEREQFESGMVRDTQKGKIRFDLALDGPIAFNFVADLKRADAFNALMNWKYAIQYDNPTFGSAKALVDIIARYEGGAKKLFVRYAELMTRGAEKYSARNWMKATGEEEMKRAVDSCTRHFFQWWSGDRTEDHAAAVLFNLNLYEYAKQRLQERSKTDPYRGD